MACFLISGPTKAALADQSRQAEDNAPQSESVPRLDRDSLSASHGRLGPVHGSVRCPSSRNPVPCQYKPADSGGRAARPCAATVPRVVAPGRSWIFNRPKQVRKCIITLLPRKCKRLCPVAARLSCAPVPALVLAREAGVRTVDPHPTLAQGRLFAD